MVVTSSSMPTKLPKVSVYMNADLKAKLEQLAEVEHRSVSQMIVFLVSQAVKEAEKEGKI